MKKDNAYLLREKKVQYYYEEVLTRKPYDIKIYEIFDGNEVKWGVKEDYITVRDEKYCRSTPLFQNMQDRYGYDKERIIYLKDYKFIIHGKLNDSEVLCKIDDNNFLMDTPLVTIEDFGGKNVKINHENNDIATVNYNENGLSKYLFFDLNKFKSIGNTFDAIYGNSCFLKSYAIDDQLRLFIGKIDSTDGTVKPIGYDINKRKFIDLPIDQDGFLNEYEMWKYIQNEKTKIMYSVNFYKSLKKSNLVCVLIDLGMDIEKMDWFKVLTKLHEDNRGKIYRK